MDPEKYLAWLTLECGYRYAGILPTGKWAAIQPLAYTWAIITGTVGNLWEIDDRWCYHNHSAALAALAAWDGTGEPKGWHRHPASGRRVAESEGERDENGRVVPIGEMYVRG